VRFLITSIYLVSHANDYVTRGHAIYLVIVTRLFSRGNEILCRGHENEIQCRGHELHSRSHELLSRGHEIAKSWERDTMSRPRVTKSLLIICNDLYRLYLP
jgi:hypothetical protein